MALHLTFPVYSPVDKYIISVPVFNSSALIPIVLLVILPVLFGVSDMLHDDVLVFFKTQDENLNMLEKGIYSQYFTNSVEFLGHAFSNEGAQLNLLKVRAILEAPLSFKC